MIREHWRELGFWRWWWHNRVPTAARLGSAAVAVLIFLGGGFLAADRLATASTGLSTGAYTFETTVEKVVTVHEHGKTVVKRVPVIRRITMTPQTVVQTVLDTRVITTPGGVRVVERKVVRTVPVISRRVVTVNGKTRTTTETRLIQTTRTQTQTQTQIQTAVVTNQNTTTLEHTHTDTLTQTQTVTQTQTQTALVTVTQTVTATQTLPAQTVTDILTVTLPGITVTVP